MFEKKITKGEWKVNKEHPNIVHCNGGKIADTLSWPNRSVDSWVNRDCIANAKAISAVPDMIDTLLVEYEHVRQELLMYPLSDRLQYRYELLYNTLKKTGCIE